MPSVTTTQFLPCQLEDSLSSPESECEMKTKPVNRFPLPVGVAGNLAQNTRDSIPPQNKNSIIDPVPLSELSPVRPPPSPVLQTSEKLIMFHYFSSGRDVLKELLLAVIFGIWGIFVAIVVGLIPRRFRYKDVTGQIVLVTGAGSGIGRLMAKKFALNHGAIVVAWDINQKGNEETVKDIRGAGGQCHGYTVDVSSREAVYRTAEKVKAQVGKVDILINNAGIVTGKRLLDTPDESIVKTFEVNALSNYWTAKAFLPAMFETGRGHIVTIASSAGLFGTNRLVDYCGSKFAAVGFDEALKNEIKVELGREDIHTTVVCPYYINTGMFDGVRSKIIPLLSPEPVADDIVAGVLTNQEQIVIPRYISVLILIKFLVPGNVGRRLATAFGITGAMLSFKGGPRTEANDNATHNGNGNAKATNGKKSK